MNKVQKQIQWLRDKQILDLYNQGKTSVEIVNILALKVTPQRVRQIIAKYE